MATLAPLSLVAVLLSGCVENDTGIGGADQSLTVTVGKNLDDEHVVNVNVMMNVFRLQKGEEISTYDMAVAQIEDEPKGIRGWGDQGPHPKQDISNDMAFADITNMSWTPLETETFDKDGWKWVKVTFPEKRTKPFNFSVSYTLKNPACKRGDKQEMRLPFMEERRHPIRTSFFTFLKSKDTKDYSDICYRGECKCELPELPSDPANEEPQEWEVPDGMDMCIWYVDTFYPEDPHFHWTKPILSDKECAGGDFTWGIVGRDMKMSERVTVLTCILLGILCVIGGLLKSCVGLLKPKAKANEVSPANEAPAEAAAPQPVGAATEDPNASC
jgi:hypothetical protein